MNFAKSVAYDKMGVPYYYSVERKRNGVYYVTIDGSFYASAESRAEAEEEIASHIAENGLTFIKPM